MKDSHRDIGHDIDEASLIIDRFFPPRFLAVLIVLTKDLYVFIRHGLSPIIALYLFTTNGLQKVDLGLRFCSFSQGMDTQFLGHEDDSLEDAAALFIEIAQKGHVDLEFIEMIVMQDVERRIGTAEVIEPDLIARPLKLPQGLNQVMLLFDQRRFRHFDADIVPLQVIAGYDIFNHPKRVHKVEIMAR